MMNAEQLNTIVDRLHEFDEQDSVARLIERINS
jgi:hypothetical protein